MGSRGGGSRARTGGGTETRPALTAPQRPYYDATEAVEDIRNQLFDGRGEKESLNDIFANRLRNGGNNPPLPDNATPEQIARAREGVRELRDRVNMAIRRMESNMTIREVDGRTGFQGRLLGREPGEPGRRLTSERGAVPNLERARDALREMNAALARGNVAALRRNMDTQLTNIGRFEPFSISDRVFGNIFQASYKMKEFSNTAKARLPESKRPPVRGSMRLTGGPVTSRGPWAGEMA